MSRTVACLSLCAVATALPAKAFGDDVPAGDDRARAVAAALENENLRIRARIESAGILDGAGRHEEAVAALKGVEDVHAEGKSLVERLLAMPPSAGGAPAGTASGPMDPKWEEIARRAPRAVRGSARSDEPADGDEALARSPAVGPLSARLIEARGHDRLWRPANAGDPAEPPADLVASGMAILALLDAADTRNPAVGEGVAVGPRSDAAFESLTALAARQDAGSGRFGNGLDADAHPLATWALAAGVTRFGEASWRAPLTAAVARALADRNARGLWASSAGSADDDWVLAAFEVAMLHEARPHADPAAAEAIDAAIERVQRLAFADQITETALRTDAGSYARSCLAREARRDAGAADTRSVAFRLPMVSTADPRLDATGLLFATTLRLGGDGEDLRAWSKRVLEPLETGSPRPGDDRSLRHGPAYADACVLLSLLAPTSLRPPKSP